MKDREPDIAELVYDLVRMVPKGRVCTYGAIARAVGLASGARLVGRLMGLTKSVAPKVPAHRIVNSSGLLSGKFHFGPGKEMQQLLEQEGISIVNNRVRDFSKLFWDPMKELS